MSVEKSIKRYRYDEGPGPGQGSHSHRLRPLLRMCCLVPPWFPRGWHVMGDIGWCPLSSMVTQHRVSSLKHWDQCKHDSLWSDENWEMEKVSTETFINLISQKRNILCVVSGRDDMILTRFYFSFQVMNNSFQYCVMNIGARTWIKMNLEWNYAGLVCLQNFILRNMFVQTKLWCRFIWKHTIQI